MSEFDDFPTGDMRYFAEYSHARSDAEAAAEHDVRRYRGLIVRDELVDVEEQEVARDDESLAALRHKIENSDPRLQTIVVTLAYTHRPHERVHWVVDRSKHGRLKPHLLVEHGVYCTPDGKNKLGVVDYVAPDIDPEYVFAVDEDESALPAIVRCLRLTDLEVDADLMEEELRALLGGKPSTTLADAVDVQVDLQHILRQIPMPYEQREAA